MQGQVIDVSTSFFPLCWSLCGLKLLLCENKKKQKKTFFKAPTQCVSNNGLSDHFPLVSFDHTSCIHFVFSLSYCTLCCFKWFLKTFQNSHFCALLRLFPRVGLFVVAQMNFLGCFLITLGTILLSFCSLSFFKLFKRGLSFYLIKHTFFLS